MHIKIFPLDGTIETLIELFNKNELLGCLWSGIPNELYHHPDFPGVSRSALMHINDSPAVYQWEKQNKRPATKAMDVGSMFHHTVLEPATFTKHYQTDTHLLPAEAKSPRATKVYKEALTQFKKENPSLTIVSKSDLELTGKMKAAAVNNSLANKMINNLLPEVSFWWTDEKTGLLVKGRCDGIFEINDRVYLFELKSIDDIKKVERSITDRGYDVQSVFYCDGLSIVLGKDVQMIFCFVEKKGPYQVQLVQVPPDSDEEDEARSCYRDALTKLDEAVKTDKWPGLPEEILQYKRPRWAFKYSED